MNSSAYTDYDIQALVDDELDYEEAKRVQEYINNDPQANRRYNELLQQKQLLRLWWYSEHN